MAKSRVLPLILIVAVVMLVPTLAWACPMCKDALVDGGKDIPQRIGLAKGFAWSIYALLSVPFLLVGGISAMIVRASRRKAS